MSKIKHQKGFIQLGIIGLIVLTAGLFAATKLASNPDLTFFNISEEAKGINEEEQCQGCLSDRELRWVKRTKKDGSKIERCVSIKSSKCTSKPLPTTKSKKACVVSGCNEEFCVEKGKEVTTTCNSKPKYGCYKIATCEEQAGGECDWTQSEKLETCLGLPPCGDGLYCTKYAEPEGSTRCLSGNPGNNDTGGLNCCPLGQKIVDGKCQ